MEISAALAAQLVVLTDALGDLGTDDPEADLESQLGALMDALKVAVPSFLGLSLTTVVNSDEVTLHLAVPGGSQVATSLLLPLPTGGALALYAATPGTFVDTAADLTCALDLPPGTAELDGHLAAPAAFSDAAGLEEMSIVNRAIGVLIGHGHTIRTARDELRRRAGAAGETLPAVARRLLRDPAPPAPGEM